MNQNESAFPESNSRLETIGQLRAQLVEVMPDAETMWRAAAPPPRRGWAGRLARPTQPAEAPPTFRGHLAFEPDQAYNTLRARFATLGYTPLLRRHGDHDLVIALPHVFPDGAQGKLPPARWVPNVLLLLLTIVTTTLMGAVMEQGELLVKNPMLFFQQPALILTGIPASLTIMSILGIHELGHYFMARRHGLETTLPYFIPVPFGFGTFGAIIRIRTPWQNRKALFDVGIAGPLAGLCVALPLFFLGLMTSPHQLPIPEGTPLGSPLLLRWMENAVYAIRSIPEDHEIYVNAMTFAAWFGLVVTGFNLLPVGQLDGGHVAYAVLGRWAKVLGIVVLGALVVLGIWAWNGWYMWAAFIFLSGWQHPAPLNALAPLGRKRVLLGLLAFVLIVLLFTPAPFPI
jgi:membrane-associated protease RseP (regulator of RpoE activity)